MTIRCQVGFYSNEIASGDILMEKDLCGYDALIYRHSDGYPRGHNGEGYTGSIPEYGMLSDILPFVREFMWTRGADAEYMAACMLAYLKQWHCGNAVKYDKYSSFTVNGITMSCLGHGVCQRIYEDINYFYAVTPTRLIVFRVRPAQNKPDVGRLKLCVNEFVRLESHDITKKN